MKISSERDVVFRRWIDIFDLDWLILGPVLFLIFFGLLLLKSASDGLFFSKQVMFIFPAFVFCLSALIMKIGFWHRSAWWIYLLNIIFLLLVLIKGSSSMGAQRWIDFGIIQIQPSEVAKIALIITLAAWFTKYPVKNYIDIFTSGAIVTIPFLLIFKQPDLGTALVFIAIYLGMAFWAGASLTHLLIVLSPVLSLIFNATSMTIINFGTMGFNNKIVEFTLSQGFVFFLLFLLIWLIVSYKPWKSPWIVLFISFIIFINFIIGFIRPILWSFLHTYQQRRLTIFLNPESDPQGAGYHIIQSILAIGNGGFFGYGWHQGRLTKGDYVPAQHTDFVFSIVGEEFGFLGAVVLITLFIGFLLRILYIGRYSNDKFASLIAIGIFSFFSFHVFVNIGMTLGIMPITGVPLPFLSYGGTAFLTDVFAVFLLLSISWRTLPRKIF